MAIAANLGFPRIGLRRELKRAVEAFWKGQISFDELEDTGRQLRQRHWLVQQELGITHIPSNDFSFYDHVLDTVAMVGATPERFRALGLDGDPSVYFAMARGSADAEPMDMTKWFDTNYHYIVPEFDVGMKFHLASTKPIDYFLEAKTLGITTRPVLLGPVTFLLLGKSRSPNFQPLTLLNSLMAVYEKLLAGLAAAGAEWVQIDEPILGCGPTAETLSAVESTYAHLASAAPQAKICLTTYFGGLGGNLPSVLRLPVAAVHLDLVRAPEQLAPALEALPQGRMLSLGVVDGRNVWRTDLPRALDMLEEAAAKIGKERILVAPSCSLLHAPIDIEPESHLDASLKNTMAFGKQKLAEIAALAQGLNQGREAVHDAIAASEAASSRRANLPRARSEAVRQAAANITPAMLRRNRPFAERRKLQKASLKLPLLPTTTIGSFPQTAEVRRGRAALVKGEWPQMKYDEFCREQIAAVVKLQEELDLDVLVHGEFERTDMVEYFGQQLEGFTFTENGWVQSYGSRCVKPPVIFGDVRRAQPMTVAITAFAQSLTPRPMKGMLTGPITLLRWSFVRDDQPQRDTAMQLALAIRDEVLDLEQAGIRIIQIDEPALREGMPLDPQAWRTYLAWAVDAFRLASCGVKDETQIHTHMCYSEFNHIIESIAAMDADVISIEASRSDMELLDAFARFHYPNEIGPGVYDIHTPRVPETDEIVGRLKKALRLISREQLWVNPDCGLKTREPPEAAAALRNMVEAAKSLREELSHS